MIRYEQEAFLGIFLAAFFIFVDLVVFQISGVSSSAIYFFCIHARRPEKDGGRFALHLARRMTALATR